MSCPFAFSCRTALAALLALSGIDAVRHRDLRYRGAGRCALGENLRLQRRAVSPATSLLVRIHRVHHELIVNTIVGGSPGGFKMGWPASYE
jgi:hypothetical protein